MNIFDEIKNWLSNSPVVILIFLACAAMLFIGTVHGIEDIMSTYYGIQTLQGQYNIRPVIFGITYGTTACSFSVGQIVLLYLYMADTKKNKRFMLGYFALFALDTAVDVYYRSNGFAFPNYSAGAIAGNIIFSFLITLVFYTIFSEVFLTMGFALTFQLIAPAIVQWERVIADVGRARKNARAQIDAWDKPKTQSGIPFHPTPSKALSIAERRHPGASKKAPTVSDYNDLTRFYEQ